MQQSEKFKMLRFQWFSIFLSKMKMLFKKIA